MFRVLGSLLLALFFGIPSAKAQEVVPLNSTISGAVQADGDTVVFRFDALQGLVATLTISGQDGLAPVVRLIDPIDGKLLEAAFAGPNGKASITKLTLPKSGELEVEVSGSSDGLSGKFTGELSAKLPKSMKSAKFAKDAAAGSAITFFALAGTRLDAELDVKTKPHPLSGWCSIVGPAGVVDYSHNVFYTGLSKHASIKKVTLPMTGLYTVAPINPSLVLGGKIRLIPPKAQGGQVDVGSVVKLAAVATPTIDALPSALKTSSVTVTGAAIGAKKVEVVAHPSNVVVDVINDTYSALVPLATNSLNVIYVTALDDAGRRSLPAIARVIHDSEPPILTIIDPINNQSLVGTKFTVSGVIGDRLTPEQGVTVTVNGLAADVEQSGSGLGSFEKRDIALGLVSTSVVVVAKDVLGNQVSKTISVKKTSTTGQSSIGIQAGDAQTAVVRQQLSQPMIARVLNSLNQPIVGASVTFKVSRGDAQLGSFNGFTNGSDKLLVTTDINGDAIAFVRLGSEAGYGSTRVTATASGALGVANFTTHAIAGDPIRIAPVEGILQSTSAGAELPDSLGVRVTDGLNPVANQAVRLRVLSGGGSFSTGAEIVLATNSNGMVHTNFRMGTSSDVQRIEALLQSNPSVRAEFGLRLAQAIGSTLGLTGVVLDSFNRSVVGATVTLHLNGVVFGSVVTDTSGRYTFEGLPSGGSARIVIDGATVTGVAVGGGVTSVSYPFGSVTLRDIHVVATGKTVCAKPAILPGFVSAVGTYSGALPLVASDSSIEDFKVTLATGTVVTLANGLTVPGLGGSVSLRFTTLGKDDMPAPLPDGAEFAVGFAINPPSISFNGPLAIELPDVLGVGKGGRAVLLHYDDSIGRLIPVAELSSDGSKLVSDAGSGLQRSGIACVVSMSRPLTTVFDCAGTQLAEISRLATAHAKTLNSDSGKVAKLEQVAADIAAGRATLVDAGVSSLVDLSLSASEWSKLRTNLGKLEVALVSNDASSSNPLTYVALAALEDELPMALAEFQSSGCSAEAESAANNLLGLLSSGLDDGLDALALAAVARDFTRSALVEAAADLRATLLAPGPVSGVEAEVQSRIDAIVAADASFQAANAAFLAALADDFATPLVPLVTALASETATFPTQPALVGAMLNGSGAHGLVGSSGSVRLSNVPTSALGARHSIDATLTGLNNSLFGRSAAFEALVGGQAFPLTILMSNVPPTAPSAISISPSTCVIEVGSSKQLSVLSTTHSGIFDVTSQAAGTQYRSGNTAVAEVDVDGAALAKGAGQTYITAENSNAIGVRRVLSLGTYAVTITGFLSSGSSGVAGATVYGPNGVQVISAADGSFSMPLTLASDKASFDLIAAGSFLGAPIYGSLPVTIEVSGPLNVGTITLIAGTNVAISKAATVVSGTGSVNNALTNMLNGVFLAQGSGWTSTGSCWWTGTTQTIEIDLNGKFVLASGICQADNNDTYLLEYLDAATQTWKTLWNVPDYSAFGGGLQTRPSPASNAEKFVFTAPAVGTKLRIRATGGDGSFSISELQVYGVVAGN